jgi:hypothetical protein
LLNHIGNNYTSSQHQSIYHSSLLRQYSILNSSFGYCQFGEKTQQTCSSSSSSDKNINLSFCFILILVQKPVSAIYCCLISFTLVFLFFLNEKKNPLLVNLFSHFLIFLSICFFERP